jgi:hypothetical protein
MSTFEKPEIRGRQIAIDLVPIDKIVGDDDVDTRLLLKMAEDAVQYVAAFSWCEAVLDSYFGGGFGGIFAVFFCHIHPSRAEVDPWIWIMVGETPPAFLPIADCESQAEAFQIYMRGMSKWVEYARRGETGSSDPDVPPVNLPATPECAEALNSKLYWLIQTVKHIFEPHGDRSDSIQ